MTRIKGLLLALIVLLALTAGAISYWQQQLDSPIGVDQPTLFTVPAGATGHSVVSQLQQAGLTDISDLSARLWLKLEFSGQHVRTGTYQLLPSMSLPDVFALLASGDEHQFSISLVEGLTFAQWQTALASHDQIDFDLDPQTLKALRARWSESADAVSANPVNVEQPKGAPPSLEGLLLADTYHFTANTRASAILYRAMQAMQDFLQQQWPQRARKLPLASPFEALTLASIIEKETAVPAERAKIAGVFVNRLNKNMRLQTDPTVIYGLGEAFDGNLTRAHLRQKTPYNTYVIKGLPPGPIAMAGRPAILAALQPEETQALYFVARGDGSHQFSRSLDQHNQAVRKYQLNQR